LHGGTTFRVEFHCYDSNPVELPSLTHIVVYFFRGYFPGSAHTRERERKEAFRQSKQPLYCVRARASKTTRQQEECIRVGWLRRRRRRCLLARILRWPPVYQKQFARLSRKAHYSGRRTPAAFLCSTRPHSHSHRELLRKLSRGALAFLPNCLFIKFERENPLAPHTQQRMLSRRCLQNFASRFKKPLWPICILSWGLSTSSERGKHFALLKRDFC
jgi:hypothetical protein